MTEKELVTVIVPVYKTQRYLRKCLDSIINQTYRNLQIILIDDGSPDRCGEICDEYGRSDNRVEVIHKDNGGLASVRNCGIKAARGEWIAWVDSDDWVEEDMIEYLVDGALENNADICICGRYDIYERSKYYFGVEEAKVVDSENALRMLLDPKCRFFENYAWDKLWRKSLYEGIAFPEGKTFEDFAVTFRLLERADKIACLPDAKYNYLQRRGSIMQDTSILNTINRYDAAKARFEGLIDKWPQFEKLLVDRCVRMGVKVWTSYNKSSKEDRKAAKPQLREMSKFLTPFVKAGSSPDILGQADKLIVKLLPYPYGWSFFLTRIINFLHDINVGNFSENMRRKRRNAMKSIISAVHSIKNYLKEGKVRRLTRYIKAYRKCEIKENTILYETFWGRGMMCNPYALFRYLLDNPDYSSYEHIWVLDKVSDYPDAVKKYIGYKNVHFVNYMERDYLKALAEAKYLINNTAFPYFFIKKSGQITVNTWHGIPLKKIGPDAVDGVLESGNAIRNFLQTDYMISANSFMTEIYRKTYSLEGLYTGAIIEEGYPRLDTLVREDVQVYKDQLVRMGVSIDPNRKIILFAPTWRETQNAESQISSVMSGYKRIRDKIEAAHPEYQVLVKVHQYVYRLLKGKKYPSFIIPATVDANEVLPVADILLVDYSSIYFDYLHYRKPILFYIPDISRYADYRGLYFTAAELPGPASEDLNDVISWIGNIEAVQQEYADVITEAKKWCCNYEVGRISKYITDIVFNGNTERKKVLCEYSQKRKLLIQTGKLDDEPLVHMLLSIQEKLDFNEWDVTLATPKPVYLTEKELFDRFDNRMRIMVLDRSVNMSLKDAIMLNAMEPESGKVSGSVFQEEVYRRYPGCSFDVAVHLGEHNPIDLVVAAILRGEDIESPDFDMREQNRMAVEELMAML